MSKPLSSGAVIFCQIGETQDEIAAKIGVSHGAVVMWQNGDRVPGLPSRTKLLRAYGIPIESWDPDPVEGPPPVPVHVAPRRSTMTADGAPTTARRGRASIAEYGAKLESMVHEMMRQLDDPATNLPLPQRAALHERISRTLEKLQKIRGEAVSELKVVRHPKWIELRELIFGALQNHPDAALDVLQAIDRASRDELGEEDERENDDESQLASAPA